MLKTEITNNIVARTLNRFLSKKIEGTSRIMIKSKSGILYPGGVRRNMFRIKRNTARQKHCLGEIGVLYFDLVLVSIVRIITQLINRAKEKNNGTWS